MTTDLERALRGGALHGLGGDVSAPVEALDDLAGAKADGVAILAERGEIAMTYRTREDIPLDISSTGRGLQQTLLLLAHLEVNPGSVLLLDEPDAHLDAETAAALLADLWRHAGGRSVLLVSHGNGGPFERCRRVELVTSSHRGDAADRDIRLHP